MKTSMIAGVALGVLVILSTLVMGFTGWYKHPVLAIAFLLVIPINIGVVVWGLLRTAKEGRRYGGQIAVALVIGVVASVLVFFNSLLFTGVLFPTYLADLQEMQGGLLRMAGQTQQEIDAQLELAGEPSAIGLAIQGVVGTMGTSLVTGLIAAVFIRKK